MCWFYAINQRLLNASIVSSVLGWLDIVIAKYFYSSWWQTVMTLPLLCPSWSTNTLHIPFMHHAWYQNLLYVLVRSFCTYILLLSNVWDLCLSFSGLSYLVMAVCRVFYSVFENLKCSQLSYTLNSPTRVLGMIQGIRLGDWNCPSVHLMQLGAV